MTGMPEKQRTSEQAAAAEEQEYFQKATKAVSQMLEGSLPPQGEDYGPWNPYVIALRQTFEQQGGDLQQALAAALQGGVPWVDALLHRARRSDGLPWKVVLARKWEQMVEAERRKLAEQRMQERLARSTGDSMADEILAMLREQALSRTDIYRRYNRNVSAERINEALFVLERLGWARWEMVSTGGRKREVWSVPADEEG
jgi:hypothetical protein